LTNAIEYREAHGENDSTGKEYYQRCVKTIFQVGVKHDDSYKTNLRFAIRIHSIATSLSTKERSTVEIQIVIV
jgi:hypothetical protein